MRLLLTVLIALHACGKAPPPPTSAMPATPPAVEAPAPPVDAVPVPSADAAPAPTQGKPSDAMDKLNATRASAAWLKLVDEGDYATSWETAASFFKGNVAKEQWTTMVGGVRQPLGKVVSRGTMSQTSATSLPGAPDGKYVVIQYQTTFEKKAAAVETVTPMLEADGTWRVSGYFVK